MSIENLDPVQGLFEELPSPREHYDSIFNYYDTDDQYFSIVKAFIKNACGHQSVDQDFDYLVKIAKEARDRNNLFCFWAGLGFLGMERKPANDDNSPKARQLRYLGWVRLGRKDEDFPSLAMAVSDETHRSSGEAPSRAVIPAQATDLPRSLSRSVSMFDDLFTHILSETFMYPISDLAEKGGILTLNNARRDYRAYQGLHVIERFPARIAVPEEDERAAITYCECETVLTEFQPLVDHFIRPLCMLIEKIEFWPKNIRRPTQDAKPDGTVTSLNSFVEHVVTRITLHNGEQYAFDPTAAQIIGEPKKVEPSSSVCTIDHLAKKATAVEGISWARSYASHRVSSYLQSLPGETMGANSGDNVWMHILCQEDEAYDTLRNSLLQGILVFLREEFSHLKASPLLKCYWDRDLSNVMVTIYPVDYRLLRGVWFDRKEYQELNNSDARASMRYRWNSRMKARLKEHDYSNELRPIHEFLC
ncbi:hypothetical protein F5B20DRAFT_594197 [Whalleya microplaca]|nr:hypothetical protein F5B20DRAFT_594197 [Whalleya microplaca]